MRAPKVTEAQKDAICTIYEAKKKTITEIAMFLNVSYRTVCRVLNNRGMLTERQQKSTDAQNVLSILYRYKITPDELENILITHTMGLSKLNSPVTQPIPTKASQLPLLEDPPKG